MPDDPAPVDPACAAGSDETAWLLPSVRGIGAASLLSDLGHEVPTSLLPSFLTSTLGAPAAALGVIEGVADGLAGVGRLGGGVLAEDPEPRRATAIVEESEVDLARLRSWLGRIRARDYFEAPGRAEAEAAIERCSAALAQFAEAALAEEAPPSRPSGAVTSVPGPRAGGE